MPARRWETIQALAAEVAASRVDLSTGRGLDDFVASVTRLPGIGAWTAHYLALRLGEPDAFPAGDLALRRAAAGLEGGDFSEKALILRSAIWRPWRAYAAMYLWQQYY
jgi:AraC family transcriptional regulator of adaptative response / DNA-3-methyladenine glycosylase II